MHDNARAQALPDDLIDILACPSCGGDVRQREASAPDRGAAVLECSCGKTYAVRDGIVRFLEA
ncbi:MAG: Trm112 family protein [Phycisphaerae bacterium]|nr:Trm112 family protein [Phycisphaerae bacterium]